MMNPLNNSLSLTSVLLVFFWLAGCSSQPPAVPLPTSSEPNAELWQWQAQGRLSVKKGNERQAASFEWRQQGSDYELLFFGPLGQGSARLVGRPFHVLLITSQGETLQAASPEGLLRQGLGWDLPLSNLIYWVRGLPAPGFYQQSKPEQLQQDGWHLEWRRFTQVDTYQLPTLLVAQRADLELRLAISNWDLSPPEKSIHNE